MARFQSAPSAGQAGSHCQPCENPWPVPLPGNLCWLVITSPGSKTVSGVAHHIFPRLRGAVRLPRLRYIYKRQSLSPLRSWRPRYNSRLAATRVSSPTPFLFWRTFSEGLFCLILPVRSGLDRRRISQFRSPDGFPAFQCRRISSLRTDGNAFFSSIRIHFSSNAIKVEPFFFGFS